MSSRASTTVSVARHARTCEDGDKNENNVCILCVFHGFWWNGMVVLCIVYCVSPCVCLLGVCVRNVAQEGHPGSVFGVFPAHTRARIRGNESEQVATVEDDVEIFVGDVCALR